MRRQVQSVFVDVPKFVWFVWAVVFSFSLVFGPETAIARQAGDTKTEESSGDENRLPPGYQAPPERLVIMDLDRPILEKDEMTKLKKEAVNNFSKVKTDCDLSPNGKKVIEGAIRYKLAEMTLKEEQSKLPKLHQRFIDETSNIGSRTARPNQIQDTSKFINQEILKRIPELLKNNFYVRLHAVEILGEIDYAPAYDLLLKVLQSKDILEDEEEGQPEAVKIAAVNSLIRILRFANPSAKERLAIATAVVADLQKPDTFWWRQVRLIEALRYCEIPGLDNDKPFVVESLLSIVKDTNRPWKVRTRACYALGRVPHPKSIKIDDVVTAIAECALQLSNETAANPRDLNWKKCFANLYFAFQTGDSPKEKDLETEKKLPGGLLVRAKSAATPAYQLLLPIFNDIRLGSDDVHIAKPPAAENLRKLTEFVRSRKSDPDAQAAKGN